MKEELQFPIGTIVHHNALITEHPVFTEDLLPNTLFLLSAVSKRATTNY